MGASRIKQIQIYVGKHFRLLKNERGWKVIVFAAVISLLVSMVLGSGMFRYDSDTYSGSFAIISACIWIGIFNSIQSICKERAIIKREHRTGLHISSYVISHMIFQAVICLIQAVVLLLISMIFLAYPGGSTYFEFFITYFLVIYSADVLGLAISSIVHSPTTAMTVMPFVLIIQLIFSGMLFTLNGPVRHVSNLTLSKWGLNAACSSADYNNLEKRERIAIENMVRRTLESEGITATDEIVKAAADRAYTPSYNAAYEPTMGNLMKQWGILLVHTMVYGAISIIALEFVDKDKR